MPLLIGIGATAAHAACLVALELSGWALIGAWLAGLIAIHVSCGPRASRLLGVLQAALLLAWFSDRYPLLPVPTAIVCFIALSGWVVSDVIRKICGLWSIREPGWWRHGLELPLALGAGLVGAHLHMASHIRAGFSLELPPIGAYRIRALEDDTTLAFMDASYALAIEARAEYVLRLVSRPRSLGVWSLERQPALDISGMSWPDQPGQLTAVDLGGLTSRRIIAQPSVGRVLFWTSSH